MKDLDLCMYNCVCVLGVHYWRLLHIISLMLNITILTAVSLYFNSRFPLF